MKYLEKYEEFVRGLISKNSTKNFSAKLATSGLGLAGEGGECADLVKKYLFHKETKVTKLDEETKAKLIKELGDLMFYISFTATEVCDIHLKDVIDGNIKKLSDRYKTGKFTTKEFKAKEAAKGE